MKPSRNKYRTGIQYWSAGQWAKDGNGWELLEYLIPCFAAGIISIKKEKEKKKQEGKRERCGKPNVLTSAKSKPKLTVKSETRRKKQTKNKQTETRGTGMEDRNMEALFNIVASCTSISLLIKKEQISDNVKKRKFKDIRYKI